MKIKFLFSMAMAATLLAACSNEDQWGDSTPLQEGQLRATMEGTNPTTRVGFAESGDFYWSNTDALGVQTVPAAGADNTENSTFGKFTLSSGGGTASAVFTGSGTAATYAVYPYSEEHSISGSSLTFHFRATYDKLTKVDQDFFTTTQGEGNSFNTAMWGTITGQSVTMKHLGGVFCIKFDEMPYASGTLTLSVANKRINGDYTVTLEDDVEIQAVDITTSTTETEGVAENEVQIPFTNATVNQPGVFYVPVPTGSYESVRVSLTNGSNETSTVVGDYTITRKRAVPLELEASSLTGESERNESLSDASTALTNTDTKTVTVSGEVTAENEVTVFSETASETPATKTLVLENVASGASLTIKDPTADQSTTSTVTNEFTLSIPYSETAEGETTYDPLDLTVNMPNTTVTLAGNGGKATYGEVTASTAENTLIVSAGVSINKLTVTKGNIRLQGDAAISEIVNSKGSDAKLYIYVEGAGYELPGNLGDNIEVVDASVDDLKEICATGGEYTLNSDITGDFVVSATEPVIINLNGHTITNVSGDNFTVNIGSTLTINGEGIVDNISHQKACIYNNGTVTLNGGTYTRSKETGSSPTDPGTDPNSFYNILNHGIMTIKAGVTVEQAGGFSSLIDNGYYNYTSGNARTGYVSGTNHANPSLTIEGGEFQGGINTVKNDDGATLTINDGTFANTTQATVQNNNVVTINGGTFNPTGTATDALQTRYFDGGNNAGQSTITAGTFNGNLYFEGASATLEVSGGTFTDPSVLKYRAENADIAINLVEDKTVEGFITQNGQKLSIDMGGHTLTLGDPTVGSAGTETNSCQLLQGSEVTFRNGTLTSLNENIVIQNYCKLLLEDMTLDTPNALYSISNNNESCTMNSVTINAKSDGFAFDVYAFSSYEGVTVTVNGNSVINGKVDFGGNNNKTNIKLIINGGTFNGALSVDETYYTEAEPNIVISDTAVFAEDIAASWEKYKNPSSAEE